MKIVNWKGKFLKEWRYFETYYQLKLLKLSSLNIKHKNTYFYLMNIVREEK